MEGAVTSCNAHIILKSVFKYKYGLFLPKKNVLKLLSCTLEELDRNDRIR